MTITLKSKYGLTVNYNTIDILSIEHDKACNRFNKSDLEGNGVKPYESVMIINFIDGTQSTFSSDWKMFLQGGGTTATVCR